MDKNVVPMPATNPNHPPKLLRRDEASNYLVTVWKFKCSTGTLAKMATIGGGPKYHKQGRTPLYPIQELDLWAQNKLGVLRETTEDGTRAKKNLTPALRVSEK